MGCSQTLRIAVAVLLGICFFAVPADLPASNSDGVITKIKSTLSPKSKSTAKISDTELQAMLMSFADTYAGTVGQSSIILENKLTTANERKLVRATMVRGTSAAYDIAAGPNPLSSMLDKATSIDCPQASIRWAYSRKTSLITCTMVHLPHLPVQKGRSG
jgi:hypothetical protein